MRPIRYALAAALLAAGYAHAQVPITTEGGSVTTSPKVSQLPIAGPLTGTEAIPIVQTGSCVSTAGTCQTNPAAFIPYLQNAGAIYQLLPSLVAGDVLSNNGTSLQWVPNSGGGGAGTVTSVSATVPSGLSVTVSNPTTTPSISIATALNGVLLGTGSGFSTALSSNIISLWSGVCDSTTFLRADGTCQAAGGGGGGSVTSVALTMPSLFSVTGSPVTTTGTLGVSLASQGANLVFASPTGSPGTPAFRALAAADIPTTLNALTSATSLSSVGTITTGAWNGAVIQPLYGGSGEAGTITGLLKANGTSAYSAALSTDVTDLWTGTCNATTYLRADGSCQAPPGSGTVTSVGFSAPSVFSVSGSPVTGTGTLALSFATGQAQNEFLATPNGSSGAVGLRAIVAADLPASITSNTSGNAATATALAATPTQCSGALATGVAASGNANCTPTPTLGASGTLGSLTLGNATSGLLTLAPVTGALGAVTASLPANTGTLAETNLAQTFSALQTFGTNISIAGVTPSGATGTGNLVFSLAPALTTPNIGAATGTSLSVSGQLTSTVATGTAPFVVSSTTNVANLNASSLNGATFASPGAIGGGTAGSGTFTALSSSGGFTNSAPGAASTAAAKINGALFTGGTGTTTWPLFYLNQGAGLPSTWSTSGTEFGINAPPSFAGNLLDFHVSGGASVASLSATGALTVSSLTDSGLTAGTSPVCPNGTGGQLTTTGCTGGGGSGTVNSGTSGQLAYYASTGTAVSGATVGGGLSLASGTLSASYSIRTVSGTTDTILSTDCANGVKYTSSSAVAVTLPQATGSFLGCSVDVIAAGAGTVTVTPTTSTINGASTLAVSAARSANITADSGNYDAAGTAILPAAISTTGSPTSGQVTVFSAATTITGQNHLPIQVTTATSGTSVTPNCTFDTVKVTASATGAFTLNDPGTCTPVDGQRLRVEVISPAGGTITYTFTSGAGGYVASSSLPFPAASTAASKEDIFEFEYSTSRTAWKFLAYNQGF